MRKHSIAGIAAMLLLGLACNTAAQSFNPAYQEGWNRPGPDYQVFRADHPRRCQAACQVDKSCKAWAYVKAGGSTNCRLKLHRPLPQRDACCFSGIVPD
jgi:hypothetical protein